MNQYAKKGLFSHFSTLVFSREARTHIDLKPGTNEDESSKSRSYLDFLFGLKLSCTLIDSYGL